MTAKRTLVLQPPHGPAGELMLNSISGARTYSQELLQNEHSCCPHSRDAKVTASRGVQKTRCIAPAYHAYRKHANLFCVCSDKNFCHLAPHKQRFSVQLESYMPFRPARKTQSMK